MHSVARLSLSTIVTIFGCAQAPVVPDAPTAQAHRDADSNSQGPRTPQAMNGGSRESVIIDNQANDSAYGVVPSPGWWTSTATPGYLGTNYLVGPVSQTHDPIVYWYQNETPQCITIEARWTAGANRTHEAMWSVYGPGGTLLGQSTVDQRYSGSTFNEIGQWNLPAGRIEVKLSRWGVGGGYAIADAIRLTPCGSAPDADTNTPEEVPDSVSLAAPYFYQYNNAYEPASTCGITSTAMAINYWFEDRVSPDELYIRYGKAQAQSPSGIQRIYQQEGLYGTWSTTGTRGQIMAHLDAGRPVVVHGFWTSSGHITTIVGYDDTSWIVNDPGGDWEVCYGCGPADHIRYAFGGGWDQDMSWDGDIWLSVSDTRPI